MFKSSKSSALHLPLLFFISIQIRSSYASQNSPLRKLVGINHRFGIPTCRTSNILLASATTGKKRRKRRTSTAEGRENKHVILTDGSVKAPDPTKSDSSAVDKKRQEERMPSIFAQPNEAIYDKYAACLAATEGLRRTRDTILDKHSKPYNLVARSATLISKLSTLSKGNEDTYKKECQRACAQYMLHSGKVIRSMGLSVSQFNQLGREVEIDKVLKERVLEQAYLYRIAATLNMRKLPLIEDPNSKQLLKSQRRKRLQMFVQSSIEIEDLREEQTKRLQNVLNIKSLPSNIKISDPAILPVLDPRVRAVVEAFPLQAEEIVKKYGLNSDEFNEMLEENSKNPIFQRKVKNYTQKHKALVKEFNACKIPDNP